MKVKLPADFLQVEICEAKPNKLFTEDQRQGIRFLRYSRSVPCAECGKRRRVMWTALYTFRALSLGLSFVPITSEKRHPPLTPVCSAHPLSPAIEDGAEARVDTRLAKNR